MVIKRQTAKKSRIVSLVNGEFVKKEGMEPSFVQTEQGEIISRARIIATIVSKFVSDDNNFASITIDDGSDTMRAKLFKEVDLFNAVQPGDLVDIIGKIKEWNDEIYMIPEVVYKITDPNLELLRRLELLGKSGVSEAKTAAHDHHLINNKTKDDEMSRVNFAEGRHDIEKKSESPEKKLEPAEKKPDEKEELRKKVLAAIESGAEGISFADLLTKLGIPEEKFEEIINDLLGEGICYEPSPGVIKKI